MSRSRIAIRDLLLSYGIAAALGIALMLWCFPPSLLAGHLPALPDPARPEGSILEIDFLSHVMGQIYFFAEPWHWPLLIVHKLDAPVGTSIGITDCIPLEAILIKLVHPLFPGIRQGISMYQGFAWLMQPVAAVFALRGAGERRLDPAVAVAIMAGAMPTFLLRMWHAALSGHFIILLALGCYFRATAPERRRGWLTCFSLLCAATLLIHPYLLAMALAVLVAVPITFAMRGEPAWRAAAKHVGATILAILVLSTAFGFMGAGQSGGFSLYSMNVLSPVWPAKSTLFPMAPDWVTDATGGQGYEGYQYLGAGLLALIVFVLTSRQSRDALRRLPKRHGGLFLMAVALTIFALSNRVYIGHFQLTNFINFYLGSSQLRSGGRMFWPVAYLILIGAVALAARRRPWLAAMALACCAVLQFIDGTNLRRWDRRMQYALVEPATATPERVMSLIGRYDKLVLAPRLECDGDLNNEGVPVIYMASLLGRPTNSTYLSRASDKTACGSPLMADGYRLKDGQLGLVLGGSAAAQAVLWEAGGARCGRVADRVFCSTSGAGIDGIGSVQTPTTLPAGKLLLNDPEVSDAVLSWGWARPELWGVWSGGTTAYLVLPSSTQPRRLTLYMRSAKLPHHKLRTVTLGVEGRPLARWTMAREDAEYSAILPPGRAEETTQILRFDIPEPRAVGKDRRLLGIGLTWMRVDPVVADAPVGVAASGRAEVARTGLGIR